jgi:hypothetical protein
MYKDIKKHTYILSHQNAPLVPEVVIPFQEPPQQGVELGVTDVGGGALVGGAEVFVF